MKRGIVILVFVVMIIMGLLVAVRKPLWNDEYFSLIDSVSRRTQLEIWQGKVGEGNNSPLFYSIQKLYMDLVGFKVPEDWLNNKWDKKDIELQIFTRWQSVVCFAIALTAIFYYFYSRYNLLLACYGLLIALTSLMVWVHWAEARPYGLWFMLSVIQSLMVLEIFRHTPTLRQWVLLGIVHVLLALTSTISVVMLLAVGAVFILNRMLTVHRALWCFMLPVAIACYYHAVAPKYNFFFVDGPVALLTANWPKDRLMILLGFFIFSGVFPKYRSNKEFLSTLRFALVSFAVIIGFLLVLLTMLLIAKQPPQGFQISNRYFLPLTAVSVITITAISSALWVGVKDKIQRNVLSSILLIFLAFRLYKTLTIILTHS